MVISSMCATCIYDIVASTKFLNMSNINHDQFINIEIFLSVPPTHHINVSSYQSRCNSIILLMPLYLPLLLVLYAMLLLGLLFHQRITFLSCTHEISVYLLLHLFLSVFTRATHFVKISHQLSLFSTRPSYSLSNSLTVSFRRLILAS